jgi:hypothetical protein
MIYLVIALDLIAVFIILCIIIKISNYLTKILSKWIKIQTVLIFIHLYIIAILYYFSKVYIDKIIMPEKRVDIESKVIINNINSVINGAMLIILSDYLNPYLNKYKSII